MRSDRDTKKKKQLLLIAFLLSVLIAVVVSSSTEDSYRDQTGPAATLVSLKSSDETEHAGAVDEMMDQFTQKRVLHNIDESKIYETDLFRRALRTEIESGESPQAGREMTVEELKVEAIYGSFQGSEKSALINDKIVQPGHELESVGTVIDVSGQGVRLAP